MQGTETSKEILKSYLFHASTSTQHDILVRPRTLLQQGIATISGVIHDIYKKSSTFSKPDKRRGPTTSLFFWYKWSSLDSRLNVLREVPNSITRGIHGGYRLVSTYDLLDSKPSGGGGVFRSKLWSSQIWSFSFGGGYSRVNFGHLKSEVFHWGGVFRSKLCSSQIWSFSLGGGLSGLKFQKGAFWRIWTKIYCLRSTVQKPASASQIVSHILRMWRLIT